MKCSSCGNLSRYSVSTRPYSPCCTSLVGAISTCTATILHRCLAKQFFNGTLMRLTILSVNCVILIGDPGTNCCYLWGRIAGRTFSRFMRLWSGGFGYTSLTCGLHGRGKREGAWAGGEEDCAVAFDSMSHGLYLLKFRSADVV